VRAVFLGGLGHEADVGHRAHGTRIEGTVFFAEIDRGLIYAGITAVRDDAEGILRLAVVSYIFPPTRIIAGIEASTITSLGTWRLVMPFSELTIATAGGRRRRLEVGLDRGALVGGEGGDFAEKVAGSRCSSRPRARRKWRRVS